MPQTPSRYLRFSRAQWAALRASTPMTLDDADVERLTGLGEPMSMQEVEEIYLPVARLLHLYVAASVELRTVVHRFLGEQARPVPYVIGLGGSVAVGKSTTARILRALLSRWPSSPDVRLVATDGFLLPNAVLTDRGLMERKGFPESYDRRALLAFLAGLKAGRPDLTVPVYSHVSYDVIPDQTEPIGRPDVVIVEGLNVLQVGPGHRPFVSDFFDFSIYVDADEADIQTWYVDRFQTLRDTVFRDESSYFHRYAGLSPPQAQQRATEIWRRVNLVNLRENILSTRERANLILRKGPDHAVVEVQLRA